MPTVDHKKIELLLFEDNEVDAALVAKQLDQSKLDCKISLATRLADGIEQVKARAFDLVLLNLNLPDSRGIDTLLTIMKASQDEVIIVLAGTDDEALSLEALKFGAQDYLNKDCIDDKDLRRSILYALERTNLRRNLEARIEEIQQREAILDDITNQQKAKDELLKSEQLESISLLAGGIAHDFNNMLTAILGNISMVRIELDDHQYSTQLVAAEKAALQARLLTQQLLSFSKGDAPTLEVTTVSEIVEECAQFILRGSKVKCSIEKGKELWSVDADKGQISQVINNLIINANQAMPDGGNIRIRIRNLQVRHSEVPALNTGDYVCIELRDEGTGISPENLKKIFNPYFTTKRKGNGLGLASSYSIITTHKGSITADSSIGHGSIFRVYLPRSTQLSPTNSNPFEAEKKEVAKETIHRGKGYILVMDDMEAMMMVAGEILTVLGYEVAYSTNGNEAIEAYKAAKDAGNPFDACVFDLTVPGSMGGEEAANILIDYDPNLVAIASSGYTTSTVMSDYKNSAFKAVLPKPYRIKEMSDVLQELLNS